MSRTKQQLRVTPQPRPCIASIDPYVPGEQPADMATGGYIKLNTNEFPFTAAPEVREAIAREAKDKLRVYPNPTASKLREALARRHGVGPEWILVGNGSDEILRLLVHAWGGPGRPLAVVEPSYSLYPVLAAQFETPLETHPLEGGTKLPESLFTSDAALCMLSVPNPPLGTAFPDTELGRLAAKDRLLVLDEAYADFCESHDGNPLLHEHPGVVLSRTFSKGFGLAGLRIGWAVARPEIIEALNKVRDSYNVNRISQAAALAALDAEDYYEVLRQEIVASREALASALRRRGFTVEASQANFIFARREGAGTLYRELKARRILIRWFDKPGLSDGVRITIGTAEENAELIAGIDALDDAGG